MPLPLKKPVIDCAARKSSSLPLPLGMQMCRPCTTSDNLVMLQPASSPGFGMFGQQPAKPLGPSRLGRALPPCSAVQPREASLARPPAAARSALGGCSLPRKALAATYSALHSLHSSKLSYKILLSSQVRTLVFTFLTFLRLRGGCFDIVRVFDSLNS
jgi:hypothetical protein